jgi:3-isopropylmalate/(R)-2-methylmalate dehydratase small subunit
MSGAILQGNAWKFGDDINTDIISPAKYMDKSYEEIGKHAMEGIYEGFADTINKGDFIVAGKNFGSGSSRETAQIALKYAGVGAIIAKEFARIFFRNCINTGLPVIVFKDTEKIAQGDRLEINLYTGEIKNLSKNEIYYGSKLPGHVIEIVKAGGLKQYLKLELNKHAK